MRNPFRRKVASRVMSGELFERLQQLRSHINDCCDNTCDEVHRPIRALEDVLGVLDRWDAMFPESEGDTPLTPITTAVIRCYVREALT